MQDADRLDALGAIGIGRAFAYSGAKGRDLSETTRYFEEKLVRLEGMMKTGEGKRMAKMRSERVAMFKGWLGEEMGVVGMGGPGGGVGMGESGLGDGNVEMGDDGMGRSETVPLDGRASHGDPKRQLMNRIDNGSEDGDGSSGEGSSSDSG